MFRAILALIALSIIGCSKTPNSPQEIRPASDPYLILNAKIERLEELLERFIRDEGTRRDNKVTWGLCIDSCERVETEQDAQECFKKCAPLKPGDCL